MRTVLLSVLRFEHEPQLAGANWSLRALFYVSIGHCFIMWLIGKIKPKMLRIAAMVAVAVGCGILTMKVQNNTLEISGPYKMLFSCYLAYLLGVFVHKFEPMIAYNFTSAFFSFVLLYLLNPIGAISLSVGQVYSLAFYILCSLLGWILLRSIAELLTGKVASFLAYAGRNSMPIVLLHFICFKLVTLVVILLRGDDILLLASFPQLDGAENGLWIAYTIVGVILPLVINGGYQHVKNKILYLIRRDV